MDESGRTFDRYGRKIFHDQEEQTMKESSNEEREPTPQPSVVEERDSEEIPLSELRQWHPEAADDGDEEVSVAELEKLNETHRKEMARRKAEEKKHSQRLAQQCWEQVSKIQASNLIGTGQTHRH